MGRTNRTAIRTGVALVVAVGMVVVHHSVGCRRDRTPVVVVVVVGVVVTGRVLVVWTHCTHVAVAVAVVVGGRAVTPSCWGGLVVVLLVVQVVQVVVVGRAIRTRPVGSTDASAGVGSACHQS